MGSGLGLKGGKTGRNRYARNAKSPHWAGFLRGSNNAWSYTQARQCRLALLRFELLLPATATATAGAVGAVGFGFGWLTENMARIKSDFCSLRKPACCLSAAR
ncbi:MAG TPA: hypothetical protein VFN09_13220 [Rhodanobacteraceae bacterium]|nr:hypothetical protein [Rhodanobacteraceae bacterium]